MFIRFDVIHERDGQTDGRTDRHCMTAKTALASRGKKHYAIPGVRRSFFYFAIPFIARGLCRRKTSVRLSVTCRYSVETAKTYPQTFFTVR